MELSNKRSVAAGQPVTSVQYREMFQGHSDLEGIEDDLIHSKSTTTTLLLGVNEALVIWKRT